MRLPRFLITSVLSLALVLGVTGAGLAQEEAEEEPILEMEDEGGKWAWRTHMGVHFKTIDDKSGLAFAVSGDYRVRDNLTIGPFAFISSSDNLLEYAWAAVARIPLEFGALKVSPFVGAGILSADFDMDSEFGFSSESSGFAAPFGMSLELNLGDATFHLTGMAIKHSLEFDVPGSTGTRTDPGSAAVMIGVGM